jgi:hypothetical protein
MRNILLLSIFLPLLSLSQNIPFGAGGKNGGMGKSTIAVAQIWSVNNNQGGLGYLENPEIGIYYTNRFLMQELSSESFVFAYPTKFGNLAFSVDFFGYSQQSEMQLGLAYAKKFNKYISLGAKFDYLQYQQPEEYGNAHAIIAEVGLLSHPYKQIYIGAYVYNPSLSDFNTSVEKKAPTIFSIGLAYVPDPLVSLTAQVDKNIEYSATYKMGVELNLKESLYIRAGVNISPNAYYLGMGYYFKNIKFDLAFSYQQVLGVSPASSLAYEFVPKRISTD